MEILKPTRFSSKTSIISYSVFVNFSKDKNSNLVLIEALKGKKCKLEIEPPVYLEEGGY